MKIIAPKQLMENQAPIIRNGGIFSRASLDLQFARTRTLDPRVTHTRQSSATYVDGDGVIRTAVTNLLTYSEGFDNAVWQVTNPGEVTIVSGVEDPLGGNTANTLYNDPGASDTGWLRRVFTGTIGETYTLSFWLRRRSGTGNFLAVVGDNINQTINGVTSDWQRFSVSDTLSSTTLRSYFKVDSAGDQFDIWGAQLEESSTAGQYVKTTTAINSAPRFDHDPTTGESLGLLVEERKTNFYEYSEDFSQTEWVKGRTTITANAATAPDGTLTADDVTETTADGEHYVNHAIDVTSGITYTVSWFAKANGRTHVYCKFFGNFPSSSGTIDLETGTFNQITSTAFDSTSFQDVGNGWYRVSFTCTANATGAAGYILVGMAKSATLNSYTGDTNLGMYFWGAQAEAGSFPTSYIPTEGSTVTRAADVASITGTNFSSWYNQSEGTSYCQVVQAPQYVAFQAMASFTGTTTADEWRLWRTNTTVAQSAAIVSNSSTLSTAVTYSPSSSGGYTFAGTIAANDAICAANGTLSVAATSGQVPTLSSLRIGARNNNAFYWNGHISRLTYWPTRLSNDTLQTITA